MAHPTPLNDRFTLLYEQQENERWELKLKQQVERTRLILSCEQEIARIINRAQRSRIRQEMPRSATTYLLLKDEHIVNHYTMPDRYTLHQNLKHSLNLIEEQKQERDRQMEDRRKKEEEKKIIAQQKLEEKIKKEQQKEADRIRKETEKIDAAYSNQPMEMLNGQIEFPEISNGELTETADGVATPTGRSTRRSVQLTQMEQARIRDEERIKNLEIEKELELREKEKAAQNQPKQLTDQEKFNQLPNPIINVANFTCNLENYTNDNVFAHLEHSSHHTIEMYNINVEDTFMKEKNNLIKRQIQAADCLYQMQRFDWLVKLWGWRNFFISKLQLD